MIEYIDLYDHNKQSLHKKVDRNAYAFQAGEFMMYVLAILENEKGQYLITKRSLKKKWAPGNWEMPGGGAKFKETSLDAIVREVQEETGLDVQNGQIVYSYFNEDLKRKDNYFVDIYHFKFNFSLKDVTLRENETIDCQLVTLNEFINLHEKHTILHFSRIMEALQQKK